MYWVGLGRAIGGGAGSRVSVRVATAAVRISWWCLHDRVGGGDALSGDGQRIWWDGGDDASYVIGVVRARRGM